MYRGVCVRCQVGVTYVQPRPDERGRWVHDANPRACRRVNVSQVSTAS